MIHLLFIFALISLSSNPTLSSSCNIVGQTEYCTSTSTITSSNCGVVTTYPFWGCSTTTLASISVNSSQVVQPPPAWMVSISNQINGMSLTGWLELIGISKVIAVPGYFVVKGLRRMPRFQNSLWISHAAIGAVIVMIGLIGFFGYLSLTFFSICLGGAWMVSYPYLGRVQRSTSGE